MSDSAISGTGPVLAPIELSDFSPTVLATAADEAALRGASLVVLHVVHDPAQSPGYYARALQRAGVDVDLGQFHQLAEVAAEVLDAFMDKAREDLAARLPLDRVEHRLVQGVPTHRIVQVADEIGARMIVMGSHGHRGLVHVLLGSVAERVARLSSMPVLIVKRPASSADAIEDADTGGEA